MGGLLRFPNINKVTISGRITRDVELKHSSNNIPRAAMCIATSRYFRDEHGNSHEQSSFIDVVAYGKTAEICAESLKKGSPVLIEGDLRTRTWTDNNNVNRKFTEIFIEKIYPLERDENYVSNYQNQNQNQGYGGYPAQSNQQQQQQPNNMNPQEQEPFPPYPEVNYTEGATENDVPF